jgi:hypothetical protein
MDIDQIAGKVLVLNKEWFDSKKSFFQKEIFYNKEKERIFEIIPNTTYHQISNSEVNEISNDIIMDIDLLKYCWDSYFDSSFKFLVYQEMESNGGNASLLLPIDSKEVADEIFSEIITFTKGFTDVKATYNFIISVLDGIKENYSILMKENNNDEYEGALDYFFHQLLKSIGSKFVAIQRQIELVSYYEEKLEFNLKQEQLAALLLILNKAGVFNTKDYNDTGFLKFCQQFFYFKFKKSYKRPSSFKSLSDKYREFLRNENTKSLEEVKEKLQKILNEI